MATKTASISATSLNHHLRTATRYGLSIQCKEPGSGKVGSFIRNVETSNAASPVFYALVELYAWAKQNGWKSLPNSDIQCAEFVKCSPAARQEFQDAN